MKKKLPAFVGGKIPNTYVLQSHLASTFGGPDKWTKAARNVGHIEAGVAILAVQAGCAGFYVISKNVRRAIRIKKQVERRKSILKLGRDSYTLYNTASNALSNIKEQKSEDNLI